MGEREIFFGDVFTHTSNKTKVIIDLGGVLGQGFGTSTLLEDGSLGLCGTDTVDEIVKITGRMTVSQVFQAADKGMQRMGDDGLSEHQIGILQREAARGSRVIHF